MDVRIGIVEDDPKMREQLTKRIDQIDGFKLVFASSDLASGKQALHAHPRVQVMLVDMDLPDGSGAELIADIQQQYPEVLSLVISVLGDEVTVIRAIKAGAKGYLLKDDSVEDIHSAVTDLLNGGSPISPAIARHLINLFQPKSKEVPELKEELTRRELEILQLASKGYSYVEVAKLLGISINTVGTYTKKVYDKLAVNSRSEALFEATRLGIVESPER